MLPTKGYFQDIECPYFNSSCGRPYCHFRHRKKQAEHVEEVVAAYENEAAPVIPTYKPTPKSQLANIHYNRSHIPISYVPDLAFRSDKKLRPLAKIENPTYKPTPLSILSSVNSSKSLFGENNEHIEVINEIKLNIASVEYDPTVSLQSVQEINFEDLSTEFDLIDEIISSDDKTSKLNSVISFNDDHKTSGASDNLNLNYNDSSQEKVDEKGSIKLLYTDDTHQKYSQKIVSDKNNKTENNSKATEIEKTIKSEITHTSLTESNKSHEKSKGSNEGSNKDITDKKVSSHHKKHKKSTSKSPTHEIQKSRDKHKSKTKHKSQDKSNERASEKGKQDSKDQYTKVEQSDKSKKVKLTDKNSSREKDKEKDESTKSEISKSKDEKQLSDNKQDKSNHRKHREKEKSHNVSTETKNAKKEKIEGKEKSRSRSRDKKNIKKEKIENKDKSSGDRKEKSRSISRDRKVIKKEKSRSRSKEKRSSKKAKLDSKERSRSKESRTVGKNKKSRSRSKESNKNEVKKIKYTSTDKKLSDREKQKNKSEDSDDKSISSNKELSDKELDCFTQSPVFSDSDVDINEDETLLECYRIFNEYKPRENQPQLPVSQESEDSCLIESDIQEYQGKKRIAHANFESLFGPPKMSSVKPKTVQTPGQILANRYKIAQKAQANREQELLMHEVHHTVSTKRPAPSLLEAARERKKIRQKEKTSDTNIVDVILKGSKTALYGQQTPKPVPKKITPVHNVVAITKAKERISRIPVAPPAKTIAQTQKSARVAHVPDISLSDIPDVLQADRSKLPVNVRTRFLTMIADECVKIYISKEEAYSRALKEEFNCYEKCKVLTSYRNSAMLTVNRLRKESQERQTGGLGLIGIGEDVGESSGSFKRTQFYDNVKKWVLTEEDLDIHNYPRQTENYGIAIIKNFKSKLPSNLDENQRICSRCNKLYHVDDDGWPLYDEECCYHPMKKRTIRGEQTYLCCRSNDEMGCATSDTHVCDGFTSGKLEGFQCTMDSEYEGDTRSHAVYALDCEMCYTTKGLELTRVTMVDSDCKTVYESLVKPLNPIIDYNTRFSGITKEQMDRTSTSILQVQANILHLCNSMTILVGHSLESDMKALKIVHGMIIDTAVLFPHKMGLPHKRALRVLASEYLRKIIQNDVNGHDSAEDAITCMELLKWKLREESKGKYTK